MKKRLRGDITRVGIIDSRNLRVDILKYIPGGIIKIVSGGVKGIDSIADVYADERDIPKLIIRPEYNKYGKAAPLKRNEIIVDVSEMVIAIWDGKSRGTKYAIDYARKVLFIFIK